VKGHLGHRRSLVPFQLLNFLIALVDVYEDESSLNASIAMKSRAALLDNVGPERMHKKMCQTLNFSFVFLL
jgi:hypothetical protein